MSAPAPEPFETRRPAWHWVLAPAALVLVVAVVAAIMYFGAHLGSRPSPSPALGTPVGQVALAAKVDFACTLPISNGSSLGFISFPEGRLSIDSSVKPVPGGKGSGAGGDDWDATLGRWVPVQAHAISPDGRSFAYASMTTGVPGEPSTSAIHVRDVISGHDRTLWQGTGNAQLMAYLPTGIYFRFLGAGNGPVAPEIWTVDANGQNAHRVGPNPPPPAPLPGEPYLPPFGGFGAESLAGGAAWSVGFGHPPQALKGPPDPSNPVKPSGPDQVLRMDLRDGSVGQWYQAPDGYAVSVIGFDAKAQPLVLLNPLPKANQMVRDPKTAFMYPDPPRVELLTAPNQAVELAAGDNTGFRPNMVQADRHGIWFSVPGSIWLFSSPGGLHKIADLSSDLFPPTSPAPGNFVGKPSGPLTQPSPPPGFPIGIYIRLAGACF